MLRGLTPVSMLRVYLTVTIFLNSTLMGLCSIVTVKRYMQNIKQFLFFLFVGGFVKYLLTVFKE